MDNDRWLRSPFISCRLTERSLHSLLRGSAEYMRMHRSKRIKSIKVSSLRRLPYPNSWGDWQLLQKRTVFPFLIPDAGLRFFPAL